MDVAELVPGLYFLRLPVGHAYLCVGPGGLTLIDTGLPGGASQIAAGIRQAGHDPAEVRQIVLTHFHADHAGAAAEISAWSGAPVAAHHADAPFLAGQVPGPPPVLAGWERPLYERVTSQLPRTPARPVRLDRELHDGDELDFGGGAVTIAVPGHTPGSAAFYLPARGVLIAGDALARRPDGQLMPGVFNTDPAQAAASVQRLAGLEPEIICCGHAEPVTRDAAALLRAAAQRTGHHPGS
jgi:glyoxylase-like metal-dependent hydrolase (beta-lactamase superfamily II)